MKSLAPDSHFNWVYFEAIDIFGQGGFILAVAARVREHLLQWTVAGRL